MSASSSTVVGRANVEAAEPNPAGWPVTLTALATTRAARVGAAGGIRLARRLLLILGLLPMPCLPAMAQPASEARGSPASMLAAQLGSNAATMATNAELTVRLRGLLQEGGRGVRAVLVVRGGDVIAEIYKEGIDHDTQHSVHSVTKSVLSILIGIALERGAFDGLDQRIGSILPEVLEPGVGPEVRAITIRHLLTMTSGFDPGGAPVDAGLPSALWRWMMRRSIREAPGSRFEYDNEASHLLSVLLTRRTGQNAASFARKHLFGPLGIEHGGWPMDSEGHSLGWSGLRLTALDMAKIGLLYLRAGRWGDRQVVPEAFVADSTREHNAGGPPRRAAYGYLWWVTKTASGLDAFFAAGFGSQLIYVVPELDLVTVLASESSISGGGVGFVNRLIHPFIEALPGVRPPERP